MRDNDTLDPRAIIDDAETALEGGHVTETLALIAQLNPPVRAVASRLDRRRKKNPLKLSNKDNNMARYLIIPLILIVALAAVLLYVGGEEMARLDMLGKNYEMTLQKAIIALAVCIGFIIALWSLALWFVRMPGRVKTGFGRKRESNGLDAVEQALLAGEAGDGDRARKKAKRAHELLGRPALTALISAKGCRGLRRK